MPLRLVLGVGGRTLGAIPERLVAGAVVGLEPATAYRFTAEGLRDANGAEVAVAPSVFTTAAETRPVYDYGRMVIGYPVEGVSRVTVTSCST